MVKLGKIFAVDFDGTLYLGDTPFPEVDAQLMNLPLIRAIEKAQQAHPEDEYILWTCRDTEEDLAPALEALAKVCSIKWTAVNDNSPRIKLAFGNTRKIVADVYIDDRAVPASNIDLYEQIMLRK